MACLLKSCSATATTTPQFYTNYLTQLAGCAAKAQAGAKFACATANQQAAFSDVGKNVGNYQSALCAAKGNIAAGAGVNIAGAASPFLQAGTSTSGLSQANPYLSQAATSGGANAAQPYLTSGMNQNTGAAAASPYLQQATTSPAQQAQQYMSPYISCVVNSIGTLGQMNLQQNLAPGATSGAVGSGQFGSQRGAQVLAQTMRDANNQILAQQNQALQTGYQSALCAAAKQNAIAAQAASTAGTLQNQQAQNALTAGSTAGTLAQQQANNLATLGNTAGTLQNQYNVNQVAAGQTAEQAAAACAQNRLNAGTQGLNAATQTQALGLNDVNALATLGAQQQAICQNKQLFPLQTLGNEANIMQGAQIPTSSVSTMTGSPLSAIAGLGSLATGLFTPSGKCGTGPAPISNIMSSLSGLGTSIGNGLSGITSGIGGLISGGGGGDTNTNSGGDNSGSGGSGSGHMKDVTAPDAAISLFSFADGGSTMVTKKTKRSKRTHKE